MRSLLFVCGVLVGLLSPLTLTAQIGNPARADSASLQQQFDNMLRVSNRFETYKVVREPFLRAFMTNVSDSISVYTREIGELQATITTQTEKIQDQTTNIADREQEIADLEQDRETISLLGIPMNKATYSTTMYAIIGTLFVLLLFALARMRYATGTAHEANNKVAKLTEELDTSKRRRLEIEQNLRRQLQDEINKRRVE